MGSNGIILDWSLAAYKIGEGYMRSIFLSDVIFYRRIKNNIFEINLEVTQKLGN